MKAVLGKKINQSQTFTSDGIRIPITFIKVGPQYVVDIKTKLKDGYDALQIGLGNKKVKNLTKQTLGHLKKAGLEKKPPRFLKEVEYTTPKEQDDHIKPGHKIEISKILNIGDLVQVSGVSKGKGFQGVMKRHKFKGGPRTHGQSDRERAPGSIGQTTTPGRVYKGKKMPGRMGNQRTTIRNLKVVEIDEKNSILTISGLVPGSKGSVLIITKIE